ncbi:putative fatty-acid-CoA ligase FadD16 [Mycobacterium ulcerans str. Harvey]|uniref:Fatty-acid-CoA ligase FadD16 n=1 Tax=Mycobacterium ulcerans str. Harvey TaxID=1299332 RepID=A0ABP3ASS9_MYCUL|nr:putative fatty-acid-CoA ligase FadD16 [Mycobacterium ulcerans str. Harvey]
MHSREPVVELLRSRVFFDWFDAVGVDDIPAVFAGEIVDRFVVGRRGPGQRRPRESWWPRSPRSTTWRR